MDTEKTTLPADFSPGDRIVSERYAGSKPRTYTVLDPVRTPKGKLRIARSSGYVTTAWWSPGWLPKGYRWEKK